MITKEQNDIVAVVCIAITAVSTVVALSQFILVSKYTRDAKARVNKKMAEINAVLSAKDI